MRAQLLIIAQLALAAVLMWTCFCRALKTDDTTHREVRLAIWFEGFAAGLVFGAPLLPLVMMPGGTHWTPSWPAWSTPLGVWLLLLLSVTLVQLVTAKYWANGQAPAQFQRHRPAGGLVFAAMLIVVGLVGSQPPAAAAPTAPEPAPQPHAITVPIFHMDPGDRVKCMAPEGCIVFTMTALALELARFADQVCGPEKKTL